MNLRRHANRRWFDLDRGAYVELQEVARALRRGETLDARAARTDADVSAELLVAVLAAEVAAGRAPPKDELIRMVMECKARKPERKPPPNVLAKLDALLGGGDDE